MAKKPKKPPIECSSDMGITISLIEGIIAQFRILSTRDLSSEPVQEAIWDMQENVDLCKIMYGLHHVLQQRATYDIIMSSHKLFMDDNDRLKKILKYLVENLLTDSQLDCKLPNENKTFRNLFK